MVEWRFPGDSDVTAAQMEVFRRQFVFGQIWSGTNKELEEVGDVWEGGPFAARKPQCGPPQAEAVSRGADASRPLENCPFQESCSHQALRPRVSLTLSPW